MRLLAMMSGRSKRFRRLPMAGGWTSQRDLPAPQGATFQALWDRKGGRREPSR
jgi:L-lactate dehydrogenase complex protein LldF